jgi:hypothetical protein
VVARRGWMEGCVRPLGCNNDCSANVLRLWWRACSAVAASTSFHGGPNTPSGATGCSLAAGLCRWCEVLGPTKRLHMLISLGLRSRADRRFGHRSRIPRSFCIPLTKKRNCCEQYAAMDSLMEVGLNTRALDVRQGCRYRAKNHC